MEHVATIAHRAQLTACEQPRQPVKLPAQIIDRVWTRMAELYGHKWTSNYGDIDADGTWARGLADMSNADLKRGFLVCLTRDDPWPPSLPEFRALCKPAKREHEAMYRFPPDRQLPHKLSDEARVNGRRSIASLKAIVEK